jgi:hypothetical protein
VPSGMNIGGGRGLAHPNNSWQWRSRLLGVQQTPIQLPNLLPALRPPPIHIRQVFPVTACADALSGAEATGYSYTKGMSANPAALPVYEAYSACWLG